MKSNRLNNRDKSEGTVNKRDYYEFRYSLDINGRDVQASTHFQDAFGKV
jgi:hypothetical protein